MPAGARAAAMNSLSSSALFVPNFQDDRPAHFRMRARAGGIEREFADRDGHAVGAEFTEAEDEQTQ
jgi:hypothetical protein